MNVRSKFYPPLAIRLLALLQSALVLGAEQVLHTEANVMVEALFNADRTYSDPANEVAFEVAFLDPTGRKLLVPAFWAGNNLWKARYASRTVGTHSFHSEYPDHGDAGLYGATGKVEVKPYSGENPLYKRGPLRVAASRRYLEHADGTPFFWLGDTWWMGLCHRLHFPDEFKRLAADRKEKGFNVIQIVAGLYPDMPPFDPRGANEAGYPWEKDYARLRPEYFDAVDQRLAHLVESGLTPCIVGAWGYFVKFMGVAKAQQHWRNLVARYGAWPVIWCVAGEANLPYYQAKGFPYDDREQVKGWTEVTRYLRAVDPFKRLITIHPTGIGRLSARNAISDLSLIDIDMLQTPHGEREAVPPTVRTVRECYADRPVLPIINGEASYEMLNGKISAQWPRAMFWACLMNGAAGHTYGANGIWQCNRPGEPHGPSPTTGSPPTGYGAIPWNEAMSLPGSQQMAHGKRLLERYPWQNFTPHPEWAAFAGQASLNLEGCEWIWFPEGKPAQDAPAEKRFFRKSFAVPPGKAIESAGLRISADDRFTAWLNGQPLGNAADWRAGRQFMNVAHLIKPGANTLAIAAENVPAHVPANPAGVIALLEVRWVGGEMLKLVSDPTWLSSRSEVAGWLSNGFDEAGWSKAVAIGRYGDAPWGRIDRPDDAAHAPQSAGIPGVVRITWVPRNEPIALRGLDPQIAYAGNYFDPVNGISSALPAIRSDAGGSWTCPPPSGQDHDWVIILEPRPKQ